MPIQAASPSAPGFTTSAPEKSNIRWAVCGLLFLATTINYMDRSVFSLIEPLLHLPFMGWIPGIDHAHQIAYDINYGRVLIAFQIAYGVGFLFAGRIIDKLGTKTGYAVAILLWACASISTSLVSSVVGFMICRALLGLGESGNFPAAIKATTEWFPSEERALATGLFNSGTNVGAIIIPWLIPLILQNHTWGAAFVTTGSMGLIWLAVWLIFPYNKLRRASTQTQQNLDPVVPAEARKGFFSLFGELSKTRGLYAFSLGKGLTDPIWWFYLFWLPKYFNENYGLDLKHLGPPIIIIYFASSFGSIVGGWFSGFRMKQGASLNAARKSAMLTCACLALPVMLVPITRIWFPGNYWPAVFLLSLAAAAHQGWSANLFSTATDLFPSTAVSTVVGIGGAAGAIGGAIFTAVVKHVWTGHAGLIFTLAGFSYVTALLVFQFLVPRLGPPRSA
jgi:ACS family hexuronate transporter-like MFS transporter